MPWPFDREYMQLALAAGLIVGLTAPLIGVFLVQRRLTLMGDGVGHIAFAGVAAGSLLGVWPVWTALVAAVGGAVLIELLRSRHLASGDLVLGIFFYGGIAGGVVLAGAGGSLNTSLFTYLFGSILTVDRGEVAVVAVLGVSVLATVVLTGSALFAMAVDEEWARVAGLPVRALNTLLSVLVAVSIVAAMRVVGILLVSALMVVPVAGAQQLAASQRGILALSAGLGAASAVVGLALARLWGLAPGGTIVLVAVAAFGLLSVVGMRTGGGRLSIGLGGGGS
jgi:zinc transport system permease protein